MRSIVCLSLLALQFSAVQAQQIVDDWKYTLRKPADGWRGADFDDTAWKDGSGGFGTRDTPGARVGTTWATNRIWLRKSFEVAAAIAKPALLLHHDEDVEVYLNGQRIVELKDYTSDYIVVPIPADKQAAIRMGRNVMAVHCSQTRGGQFIDVHLIDADNVPQLPAAKRNTKPFESELITEWGAAVTAENAWTEYPRPQLQRDNWTNLNGRWDYAVTAIDQKEVPTDWAGKILVPYCLESKLGGVQRLLDASEALWYRRTFAAKTSVTKQQWLNFEAVDYRCEVFVNGTSVGQHVGGNTPFSFDISAAIKDGQNQLIVRVEDATEEWQLRGKQVLNARGIWYTQSSGIWQTVWLEETPVGAIADLWMRPDLAANRLNFKIEVDGAAQHDRIRVVVRSDGETIHTQDWLQEPSDQPYVDDGGIMIPEQHLKLWSPASPHLYDLEISLYRGSEVIDQVQSYAGMREVGKVKDADGHWRFTLNGKPIFHWGPLDQGWWPDGLLTPPSDAAMLFDIEWLKAAGFNMIRKHIKVEPRRYYYHCDRLGMMVWQDQVSGGSGRNQGWPEWTRLKPDPVDAIWPQVQHAQFMAELEDMIDALENHPSIVCWVPFNEAWGQHRTVEIGEWTSQRDPSRLVNVASGGNFWTAGDIVDEHRYPHPGFPFEFDTNGRFDNFIKVIGEFGGHGFPVLGHLWDANHRNWGYGDIPKDEAEFKDRYVKSIEILSELQSQGIAAGVYTQTTDVEGEINGLMTYDRKVIKIPAAELAAISKRLFNTATSVSTNQQVPGQPAKRMAAKPQDPAYKNPGPDEAQDF